ncbi:MAG: glycosyltransferase family 4 protein [Actinomycetota bacterium]|nr:glycosyltransferase family 4 protein [Actinomycetota bacterium]
MGTDAVARLPADLAVGLSGRRPRRADSGVAPARRVSRRQVPPCRPSSRRRVALVCPYDVSVPGGVQTQVIALAEELVVLGTRVTVVAPGGVPSRAAGDVAYIDVGRALRVAANGSRAPVALSPAAVVRTAGALHRDCFDVVHVHEPMVPLVGLSALAAARAAVVATFHRSGLDLAYRAEAKALGGLARRIVTPVAVSEAARETAVRALGFTDVAIVPNGVRIVPGGHGDKAPVPTVVFVGRHESRKGLAVLLEAFGFVEQPARLVVIGEGPETPALRARFASDRRLEWCGAVDDETRRLLVSSADLFCAPSLGGESFGVVLLEAMAVGTAVVASDIPGYRLAAGDAAELVPPGDPVALAGALNRLLADGERRAALAATGRLRAEEHSMARVASRYLELYEAALS